MKKFAVLVAIVGMSAVAFAGGEIPSAPVPPPPAPPLPYYPQAMPVAEHPVPNYLSKVGADTKDALYFGRDFFVETVDLTVGIVTLGMIDVSKDDIR